MKLYHVPTWYAIENGRRLEYLTILASCRCSLDAAIKNAGWWVEDDDIFAFDELDERLLSGLTHVVTNEGDILKYTSSTKECE